MVLGLMGKGIAVPEILFAQNSRCKVSLPYFAFSAFCMRYRFGSELMQIINFVLRFRGILP